jgi:hypothetical protein
MPFDHDGRHVPDADMCAKFLRAHSKYLMESKTEWPYVNSASAISQINNTAADLLDGIGAAAAARKMERMTIALLGVIGRWEDNKGVLEREFIDRARDALRAA